MILGNTTAKPTIDFLKEKVHISAFLYLYLQFRMQCQAQSGSKETSVKRMNGKVSCLDRHRNFLKSR